MNYNMLITTPDRTVPGGVSSYWNAILPEFEQMPHLTVKTLQIGGHSNNIIGAVKDQYRFYKTVKDKPDLVLLNPSLGFKSFLRDGLFALQLNQQKINFAVFFHGWDIPFQEKMKSTHISFFKKTFGKTKMIFVLSRSFKQKIREWGYTGEIHVETTNVDKKLVTNFSLKDKWKNLQTNPTLNILFLARLIKEKGIYELIDAFREIQKDNKNITLQIAGDGEDFMAVSDYVKNDKQVHMLGHVDGNEKVELFKNSHIYCLPSRYGEGLPTSILEAMAFGHPIITTKAGGIKDFLLEDKMGFFVDVDKPASLISSLQRLLDNRQLVEELGIFNHKYANDHLLSSVVSIRLDRYFIGCIQENLENNLSNKKVHGY